jgi:uracil-DNA glycosylase
VFDADCSWPEDLPPSRNLTCRDCALARPVSRIIWGEGNPDASVWVLLDNPGMREDHSGKSFVCGTRQTLHSTAAEFGFSADNLYVTYVVRRRPVGKYPKDTERAICVANFFEQISQTPPKVIFCMGDVAISSLLGTEAHVKEMRGYLHAWNDHTLLVTYHPLAVRRRQNLVRYWQTDWELLKSVYPRL